MTRMALFLLISSMPLSIRPSPSAPTTPIENDTRPHSAAEGRIVYRPQECPTGKCDSHVLAPCIEYLTFRIPIRIQISVDSSTHFGSNPIVLRDGIRFRIQPVFRIGLNDTHSVVPSYRSAAGSTARSLDQTTASSIQSPTSP